MTTASTETNIEAGTDDSLPGDRTSPFLWFQTVIMPDGSLDVMYCGTSADGPDPTVNHASPLNEARAKLGLPAL
jgi:hypothetical protein